jgi:choline dehydrogenase-like flavoprotein
MSDAMAEDQAGWDVVIVGGGSAGATLAGRLSEDPSVSVLLLEAGDNYTSAETVEDMRTHEMSPSLNREKMGAFSWPKIMARRSVHQDYEHYFRGRGVGGSSAINAQVAIRPVDDDFVLWEAAGCEGWGPDGVRPHFVKLEDDEMFGDLPYHGRGGPIPVSREPFREWSSLDLAFRDAVLRAGHRWSPDINAPTAEGCGFYPYNGRDRVRVSTNDGYLEPARARANLTIRGNHLVDRVLFQGKKAIGVVAYDSAGEEHRLFGDRIVLSSGAVGSPAILMRSGIGPEGLLSDLGVPVVEALPVGVGVQDHANISLRFPMDPDGAQGLYRPLCCLRYTTGLAGAGLSDMFMMVSGPMERTYQVGALMSWVNQCFSRGAVSLVSSDPSIDPIVDMRLLDDERDRVRMVDCLRRWEQLILDDGLAKTVLEEPTASDGTTLRDLSAMTDDQVADWAVHVVRDVAHLCGGARMGSPDDPDSVVNPRLEVLGFEGLQVADASVFPLIPRANLNLTAIMVGERLASQMLGTSESEGTNEWVS